MGLVLFMFSQGETSMTDSLERIKRFEPSSKVKNKAANEPVELI